MGNLPDLKELLNLGVGNRTKAIHSNGGNDSKTQERRKALGAQLVGHPRGRLGQAWPFFGHRPRRQRVGDVFQEAFWREYTAWDEFRCLESQVLHRDKVKQASQGSSSSQTSWWQTLRIQVHVPDTKTTPSTDMLLLMTVLN